MKGKITIENRSDELTEINIDGIIGIPGKLSGENTPTSVTTYEDLRAVLDSIGRIASRRVTVNIRSTGGNIRDALLIYEALSALPCEVITRCFGYVASAATVIAQAAPKGKREISENSLYLIHRSVSSAEGNASELGETVDLLTKTDERIAAIYANRSGIQEGFFLELMNENNGNGRWLHPEEVLRYGLADKITGAVKITNTCRDAVKKLNLPEPPLAEDTEEKTDLIAFLKKFFRLSDHTASEAPHSKPPESTLAAEELERTIGEYGIPATDGIDRITELKNRIDQLEASNARLEARPTQTYPKEDPAHVEQAEHSNASAYENDWKNLTD